MIVNQWEKINIIRLKHDTDTDHPDDDDGDNVIVGWTFSEDPGFKDSWSTSINR